MSALCQNLMPLVIAVLCGSCTSHKKPARPTNAVETKARDQGEARVRIDSDRDGAVSDVQGGNLKGRVLHHGKPVAYYGVLTARNFALPSNRPVVTPVRSSSGIFEVPVPPGTWDVSIVGPGFAYKTVLAVEVPEAGVLDLGDIHVMSGFTVKGTVNHDGHPVAGADVRMVRIWELDGELENLAVGAFRAKTDANGRFVIAGVSSPSLTDIPLRIHARASGMVSLPLEIPNGDHDLDLAVFPSGVIKGVVHRAYGEVLVAVRPIGVSKGGTYTRPVSGAYAIEVPEGEYEVSLFPTTPVRHRIRVNRGTTHTKDFR